MTIRLITGVPGTGKTAFLVSELEKVVATGRIIFVDNIPGLKIEHYRAGKITEWQKGTWLHIDQYKRTAPAIAMEHDEQEDESDGNENWTPNPDVVKVGDTGELRRLAYNDVGDVVGTVPYESHKGALLVIDEAQRYFRPRPAGSQVPDHVAALEVHRHQGLDIWLVTQRPGLIDSNVRALVGQHVALRATSLGRWKYIWPEVGDIESKVSRDNAARSRYKLPKHVFSLYRSAEIHTVTKHPLTFPAKVVIFLIPLAGFLFWNVYQNFQSKLHPEEQSAVHAASSNIKPGVFTESVASQSPGIEPYQLMAASVQIQHPYQGKQFSIVARLQSANRDMYQFHISENGVSLFSTSSDDLRQAGYSVVSISDCSAKIIYLSFETFVTCSSPSVYQAAESQQTQIPERQSQPIDSHL